MTMHVMTSRPACYVEGDARVTERGVEGWGARPGVRNPFWDLGRACGAASTPAVWATTITHTPGCHGCQRARRAHEVAAGIAGQDDNAFEWKGAL